MIAISKTYNDEYEIMAISNTYGIKECQDIYVGKNKDPELAKRDLLTMIEKLTTEELLSIIESEVEEKIKIQKGKQ